MVHFIGKALFVLLFFFSLLSIQFFLIYFLLSVQSWRIFLLCYKILSRDNWNYSEKSELKYQRNDFVNRERVYLIDPWKNILTNIKLTFLSRTRLKSVFLSIWWKIKYWKVTKTKKIRDRWLCASLSIIL